MQLPKISRNWTILEWEKSLKNKNEDFWIKRGQKSALNLFSQMARRVPAYKDFLKKHKVKAEKIKTFADFQLLPPVDKPNYILKYPKNALSWDGSYPQGAWTISTTSGSTGQPLYFPRQKSQDEEYALTAELYLRTNFQIHKKKTLYIVGFPMGAWIGGVFTYEVLRMIAQRGKYDLSIITPGINKQEIIKAVQALGPSYDQIIIGSYGPFLKDALDDGIRHGLNWKKYNLGFVFSAEVISEGFRDYVMEIAGVKNKYLSTLNHYGTVDMGTMSYETPISILIRRLALKNESLYSALFGQTMKLPTLTQFLPEQFYFEEINNSLLCTASSGLPLVRYDLKDHGGVFNKFELNQILEEQNISLNKEIKQANIGSSVWNLPFVHVYERSDFSVSFFAFQIYPETIRKVVHQKEFLKGLTGKFTMMVKYDKNNNQYFEINFEQKYGKTVTAKMKNNLRQQIIAQLLKDNSEYRKTTEEYGIKRTAPKMVFWPYEHQTHFTPGIKQKWIKK